MSKPKIAFFDFTSCEGCQLTVVDSLQTHLDLLTAVEIVQFREAISEQGEDYDIAFIEGSCVRKSDEDRLRKIRAQAKLVVALGACAHLGGVNALRNRRSVDEVTKYVYGESPDWTEPMPNRRSHVRDDLVTVTEWAQPIEAIIPVDAALPGCPIDREEFVRVTKQLLQGRQPILPDYPLCVECKLKENVCLFHRGQVCLGPVTRAGCDAICPTYGDPCEACRGLISQPNTDALQDVLKENGLTPDDVITYFTMFGTYQLMQRENQAEKV
jgi:coenzyme F420-reducing hydrogenase gamma subunit